MSSRSVLRAPKTFSELVTTLMPGSTGRTQEAARARTPVSTTQRRQTPTGVWFSRWHSVGMLMPFMRAASKTVVPAGTRTGWPSSVMSMRPGGVIAVVILRADSNALGFSGARGSAEADSTGAFALQNVGVNFGVKVFQNGLNRRGRDLAEAADRSETHGLREFVEECEVGAILRFGHAALCPAPEHVRHLLRADAAGNALAAGFVAIEAHRGEGHVQHAGSIVADDDGARPQHGAGFGKSFEIEPYVDHRSGKKTGRRAGRREGFQLTAAANAAGVVEDDIADRHAHGNFEDAGVGDVATDADEFQATRATGALSHEPVNPASENLRNVDEGFNVVDDRGLLPETDLPRKRRLVARLGAMAFNGLDERAFLTAYVAAGADKNFEIIIDVAAQDFFSEEASAVAAANLLAKDFFLEMIFVADIENAALRAGHQAGDDHAFDEEMRQVSHDEAVLDRAGLAFIGVADNVFHGIGLFANKIPLHAGGKSGPAHAFQFRGFELCEDIVPGLGWDELADDIVPFILAIWVGLAGYAGRLGVRLVNLFAADSTAGDPFGMRGGDIREDVIVDGNCGSMIAAAETGDVSNLYIFWPPIDEAALEIGAQLRSAVEMAAHVGTDANLRFGRRYEMKMGIETRDAVDLIERRLGAMRKTLKFRFGQETVAKLDGPKVVEDHGAPSRAKCCRESSAYYWQGRPL